MIVGGAYGPSPQAIVAATIAYKEKSGRLADPEGLAGGPDRLPPCGPGARPFDLPSGPRRRGPQAFVRYGRRYTEASAEAARLRDALSKTHTQRDRWIKLFNRLDAAVGHHERDTGGDRFSTDADDRLWAARDRIGRDAAERRE